MARSRGTVALFTGIAAACVLGRLLPASGVGLWLRLGSTTALLFAPGVVIAARLEVPLASGGLVLSLGFIGVGLAAAFAIHGSLVVTMAVAVFLAVGTLTGIRVATGGSPRLDEGARVSARAAVVGLGFGLALWQVTAAPSGDALFHLARIRKLVAFGSLSLRSLDEFRDGGLHPGYAFPLWHGLLGVVSRLADVDPALVIRYEPAILVGLAFPVVYEAGRAIFRSSTLGLAVLVIQVALVALAPGHAGAFTSLALPATTARQIILPALLALFFHRSLSPSRFRWVPYAMVCLAAAELALVHVTYVLFAAIVLAGFLGVRVLFRAEDLLQDAGRLGASLLAVGGVVAWLAPIAAGTRSHNPRCVEIQRAFVNYRGQLDHSSCSHYDLSAAMVSRSGAIAIAALLLVPLAAGAVRRPWAALVLGGTIGILLLLLLPWVFPHFADVVSISQARRAAGFVPIPFALVGGIALVAARIGIVAPALALVAGGTLELIYPGWFATSAPIGAPAYPAWIALIGGGVAIVIARFVRPAWAEAAGPVSLAAAVLFAAPTVIKGLVEWTPLAVTTPPPLTAGLIGELRQPALRGTTVFSDPGTSYQIAAYAPVYIVSAPPSHVANTTANDPYRRWNDALAFLKTGSLAIPRRHRACTILLRRPSRLRLRLPILFRDRAFVLYVLRQGCANENESPPSS